MKNLTTMRVIDAISRRVDLQILGPVINPIYCQITDQVKNLVNEQPYYFIYYQTNPMIFDQVRIQAKHQIHDQLSEEFNDG